MRRRLIANPEFRFRMQIVSLLCALAPGGLLREVVDEARGKQ